MWRHPVNPLRTFHSVDCRDPGIIFTIGRVCRVQHQVGDTRKGEEEGFHDTLPARISLANRRSIKPSIKITTISKLTIAIIGGALGSGPIKVLARGRIG
jgi:hypothetical protein